MPSTKFVRLTGSVGQDGDTDVLDVIAVQHLINVYPPAGLRPLALDGLCGPETIAAIKAVERQHLRASNPAYALARAHLTDPDAYANALTGHYATAIGYGGILIGFMRYNELYQYNDLNIIADFGDPQMPAMPPTAPGLNGSSTYA